MTWLVHFLILYIVSCTVFPIVAGTGGKGNGPAAEGDTGHMMKWHKRKKNGKISFVQIDEGQNDQNRGSFL